MKKLLKLCVLHVILFVTIAMVNVSLDKYQQTNVEWIPVQMRVRSVDFDFGMQTA